VNANDNKRQRRVIANFPILLGQAEKDYGLEIFLRWARYRVHIVIMDGWFWGWPNIVVAQISVYRTVKNC